MTIAAVHIAPAITLILLLAVMGWIVWYWMRLGRAGVPASRRRIRRVSLVMMMLALPLFVAGLSFIDPAVQKRAYAFCWSYALILVMIVVMTAAIDAVNNLRLHQQQKRDALHETAAELAAAVRARQKASPASREPWGANGHRDHTPDEDAPA